MSYQGSFLRVRPLKGAPLLSLLLSTLACVASVACSGVEDGTDEGSGGTASGGSSLSSGGTGSGGMPAPAGGAASGGTPSSGGAGVGGGSGGEPSSGGAGVGGAESSGGESSGGESSGGAGTGGETSGFQPCPTDGPCKVLPLGDSITEDVTSPGGAWRIEFFSRALADGKNITFVGSRSNGPATVDGETFPKSHEGTSGITIGNLNGKIPSPGLNDPPHIILLHIGTNDMFSNASGAPAALEALVDDLIAEAPDALLVVSSIIPFSNVEAYNATIEPLVDAKAAEGAHILFADQYSAFPAGELADGVHPTPAGYAVMGGVYYDLVESYLP